MNKLIISLAAAILSLPVAADEGNVAAASTERTKIPRNASFGT